MVFRGIIIFLLTVFSGDIELKAQVYRLLNTMNSDGIPFANIAIIGKSIGASSDENGYFKLPQGYQPYDSIRVTAVGFEDLQISVYDLNDVILLKELVLQLPEVQVKSHQVNKVIRMGSKFKKASFSYFWISGNEPFIMVRHFEKPPISSEYPYLDGFYFFAEVEVIEASVSVRLYKPDTNGLPGRSLLQKPLLVKLQKGRREHFISLRDLHIKMPEEGCLIGLEWLLLPENKLKREFKISDSREKKTLILHAPSIGVESKEPSSTIGFHYTQGRWVNFTIAGDRIEKLQGYIRGQSLVPAMQLQLGN